MGVFLRWGVFGILAVAALLYAYNASKRFATHRPSAPQVVSQEVASEEALPDEADILEEGPEERMALPPLCAEELQVAERALKMRRDGEPLDRVLRIDRIIFQSDELRRERLATVARHWFEREGRDPDANGLAIEVQRDCERARATPPSPAP